VVVYGPILLNEDKANILLDGKYKYVMGFNSCVLFIVSNGSYLFKDVGIT